jgi:histidine triad (HIT) family protein
MSSLFTKIIQGEIPSYKVYEDEKVYAFLDIQPIHLGHVLVVPKKEVDHYLDVAEEDYLAVQKAVLKIGKAIKKVTGAPRIGQAVLGFEVPHFHVHLIPLWSQHDLNFGLAKKRSEADMKAMHASLNEEINRF